MKLIFIVLVVWVMIRGIWIRIWPRLVLSRFLGMIRTFY